MTLIEILKILQIFLSAIMIASVLLQQRGEGLGTIFSASGGEFYRSRRGIEKFLHYLTIGTAVLFCVNALAIIKIS